GVVAGFTESVPGGDLRSVIDCVDPEPLVPPDLLELCRWTARYYLVSLADVIGTIVPSRLPEPAAERVLVLARHLTAEDERTLARRAGAGGRPRLPASRRRRGWAAHGARPPCRGDRAGRDRGPRARRARGSASGAEVTRRRARPDGAERDRPDRRAARGGRCHRR